MLYRCLLLIGISGLLVCSTALAAFDETAWKTALQQGESAADAQRWEEARTQFGIALTLAEGEDANGLHAVASLTRLGLLDLRHGLHYLGNSYQRISCAQSWEIAEAPIYTKTQPIHHSLLPVLSAYRAQVCFARAEINLQRASAIRQANTNTLPVDLASALNNLGVVQLLQGKVAPARRKFQTALTHLETALGKEHPAIAVALTNLAACTINAPMQVEGSHIWHEFAIYQEEHRRGASIKPLLVRALTIREKTYGKDSGQVAVTLCNLAAACTWANDDHQARDLLHRAQSLEEARHGACHADVLNVFDLLMACGYGGENEEQALKVLLEKTDRDRGKNDAPLISVLTRLGLFYRRYERKEEAERYLSLAADLSEATYGKQSEQYATALLNLGGEKQYDHALAIREELYGKDSLPVLDMRFSQVPSFSDEKNTRKTQLEQLLAAYQARCGEESPEVLAVLTGLQDASRMGVFSQQAELLQRRLGMAERIFGADHPLLIPIANRMGRYYDFIDEPEKGTPFYERAFALQEQALGADHPGILHYLYGLQENYYLTCRDTEREQLLVRGLALAEKAFGVKSYRQLEPLRKALLETYTTAKKYPEAEAILRTLCAPPPPENGDEPITVSEYTFADLGGVLQAQGKYAEAIRIFEKNLNEEIRQSGPNSPHLFWPISALADCYETWGKFDRAEPLWERMHAIYMRNPEGCNSVQDRLTANYRRQGKYAKAETLYLEELATIKQRFADKPEYQSTAMQHLGDLCYEQKQHVKAKDWYLRALEMAEKDTSSYRNWRKALLLVSLADCYVALHEETLALESYQRAIQLLETQQNAEMNPTLADYLIKYATLLRHMQRPDDAAVQETRAETIRNNLAAYRNAEEKKQPIRRFRGGSRDF